MRMTWLHDALRSELKRRGKEIVAVEDLYEWQREVVNSAVYNPVKLPDAAGSYLRADNPRLLELSRRYAAFNPDVTTPLVWREGYVRDEDIPYFRGDNAYVWQKRGHNMNVLGYALAFYYLQSIDHLDLLGRLTEDDAFGNFTFPIAGREVSRDLLDSVAELYFLDRELGIAARSDFTILDIGAGYGRLAHRSLTAFPSLGRYFCSDAVPHSTFISEYYLRYRGLADRATIVPLDEIERTLASQRIDLAVNIHSFSECRIAAIDWWVGLIARHRVEYLMLVPTTDSGQRIVTVDGANYAHIMEKHGYRLVAKEQKYRDPVVQKYAITPAFHFLFRLD